jgi:sugar phosphate isomerase/epimerase
MKESIHKYFQVGLIHWMSYPPARVDFMQSLRAVARDDYFDAVEIGPVADELREEVCSILRQSHLTVCYGAQPRLLGPQLSPNDLDEAGREAAEKTLLEAVDEAETLGAGGIAFLSGKWKEAAKEEAYQQLLNTTRAVCDYAATKGMMVELEVFDYDMDKAALIGPAPYAARFAADMRTTHSNFGLLIDLSHFPTTYETSRFVVQTLRPYITHLHIGNAVVQPGCDAYGDLHPRFGYPHSANDVAELAEFFTILRQEGFFRAEKPYVLSVEVTPRPHEDAEIVLAGCKRTINRAWALAENR